MACTKGNHSSHKVCSTIAWCTSVGVVTGGGGSFLRLVFIVEGVISNSGLFGKTYHVSYILHSYILSLTADIPRLLK